MILVWTNHRFEGGDVTYDVKSSNMDKTWLKVIKARCFRLMSLYHLKPCMSRSQTATRPANQVQWAEFREAFRAQHIPAGIMKTKHREFMDLRQSNQSVYSYSKVFNHLAQYALEQVDTDEKRKYHFMNGLSTKLQERLVLNTN
jgi:hypothetical protein